jgi:hypothetical protein
MVTSLTILLMSELKDTIKIPTSSNNSKNSIKSSYSIKTNNSIKTSYSINTNNSIKSSYSINTNNNSNNSSSNSISINNSFPVILEWHQEQFLHLQPTSQ